MNCSPPEHNVVQVGDHWVGWIDSTILSLFLVVAKFITNEPLFSFTNIYALEHLPWWDKHVESKDEKWEVAEV